MYPVIVSQHIPRVNPSGACQFKKQPEKGANVTPEHTVPATNISESASEYIIEMAAPGLQRNDIHISVQHPVLFISAKKKAPFRKANDRYEYNYSDWSRSFMLPDDADTLLASACYLNGELVIHIPKGDGSNKEISTTIYVY